MNNRTITEFFKRNNINPNEIRKKINCNILSIEDINKIFEEYGLYKNGYKTKVKINDIKGFDYQYRGIKSDIFSSLDFFFDESTKNSYKSRSCKELYKSAEEMLISKSFETEEVRLFCLDPILNIHRFTSLKALYLKEIYNNPEKQEKINEKYTIPAIVQDIDRLKTYSNFIISTIYPEKWLSNEYEDGIVTGRSVLENINSDKQILTDEQLITFIREILKENLDYFDSYLQNNADFKIFVEDIMSMSLS